MIKLNERTTYITPDGITYSLEAPPKRAIISREGEGMPPIEYVTQRGPFQHGVTINDYFLQPRTLQYIIRHNFCSRQAYWDGRADLLNHVRPNRQVDASGLCATGLTQGSIRKYIPGGIIRQIDVMILQGPNYDTRSPGQWDSFAIQDVLRFFAPNPVWYDPTRRSQVVSSPSDLQLVFPITFPIVFGAISESFNVSYSGTWKSFPSIVITGPFSGVTIENTSTDELIELDYNAVDGETVTICLEYGSKTIMNNSGDNLIGFLTEDSDLGTFHLAPDPEVANGLNAMTVNAVGVGANTTVTMYWYQRYIGV